MKDLEGKEIPCPVLSTGADSTLGNWSDLVNAVFGEDCPAAKFLKDKIAEQGRDEPVLADERQLILALFAMNEGVKAPENVLG
jgi:hypothetical protein